MSSIYFTSKLSVSYVAGVTKIFFLSIFFPKDKEMTDILKVQFQLAVIRALVGT